MLIKIEIQVDKKWIRKEAESYIGFFTGYINQIAGLTIMKATLEEE